MNSKKVKNKIGPFLLVVVFLFASFGIGEIVQSGNWQSIMLLTTVSMFGLYAIANAGFDLNKTRALCAIIAMTLLFCMFPFVILAWATYNLNIPIIDTLYNILNSTYEPFSYAVSTMLILVSLTSPGVWDDVASRFRIDIHLHRFNMFCGLYIFSVDPAMVK